jgi:hypothetical protein
MAPRSWGALPHSAGRSSRPALTCALLGGKAMVMIAYIRPWERTSNEGPEQAHLPGPFDFHSMRPTSTFPWLRAARKIAPRTRQERRWPLPTSGGRLVDRACNVSRGDFLDCGARCGGPVRGDRVMGSDVCTRTGLRRPRRRDSAQRAHRRTWCVAFYASAIIIRSAPEAYEGYPRLPRVGGRGQGTVCALMAGGSILVRVADPSLFNFAQTPRRQRWQASI